ncbi:Polyprenol reductase 2 [Linum perenne]
MSRSRECDSASFLSLVSKSCIHEVVFSSVNGSHGSLRSQGKKVDEYVIPYGDWFELVSSPHYLAEITVGAFTLVAFRLYDYAGFVVASGGTDLTIWLLLAFVVANLVMAAGETHMWYLHKFDTYPINRYVIIPFVY